MSLVQLRRLQCFSLCRVTRAAGPADAAWGKDIAVEKVPTDSTPDVEFVTIHVSSSPRAGEERGMP